MLLSKRIQTSKQVARIDCSRRKQDQYLSRLESRLRGGGESSKESSFADEDKALIQKLLRQQVVSAKTEKKKEKRWVLPHPPLWLSASRIDKSISNVNRPQEADARRRPRGA
jgi:hypothetical protein